MASGHDKFFDDQPGSFAKLQDLRRSTPKIGEWLRRFRRTSREYDVPYLGGISNDGSTVYIDRKLPLRIAGVSLDQLFITHETVENALIKALRLGYEPAHHLATAAEAHVLKVTWPGVSWNDYRTALRPLYRPIETEEIALPPPDLALYPYSGKPYKVLWDLQHGKITKAQAGYRPAEGLREACGACAMFRPHNRSCSLVVGTIRAEDTCERWEPKAETGRQTAVG